MNIKKYKAMLKGLLVVVVGFAVFVMVSWASYGFEGVISNAVDRVLLAEQNQSIDDRDHSSFEAGQLYISLESENIRKERLEAVCKQIDENWVWGCGFGQDLAVRRYGGKIEFTYHDMLSKMGVFGFASFLTVLLLPLYFACKQHKKEQGEGLAALVMGVAVCIYAASIYNPFITSPIGFSVYAVMVASVYAKNGVDVRVPIAVAEEKPSEYGL